MSAWLPLLLLLMLCTRPTASAPWFLGKRCENSCLVAPPGRHCSSQEEGVVSSWNLQQQNRIVIREETIRMEETTTTSTPPTTTPTTTTVWESIRSSMKKNPSFDIVPLANNKKHKKKDTKKVIQVKNQQQPSVPKTPSGTRFDLRPPSPERITQWFAPASVHHETLLGGKRKKKTTLFNHDSVGMTNPVVHISVMDDKNHHHLFLDYKDDGSTLAASTTTTDASTATSTTAAAIFERQDTWIPASSSTTSTTTRSSLSSSSSSPRVLTSEARILQYKVRPRSSLSSPLDANREAAERAWFPATANNHKWRQCRYRRRVGQGEACYERVREAALAWQFQHDDDDTNTANQQGILPVSNPHKKDNNNNNSQNKNKNDDNDEDCFSLDDQASQHVQPLWSGPHTIASRRFITYTTTGFKSKWLPKLYTMNPVMVVYDLMDQRYVQISYIV
jgi:Domain of unknown function (DUF1990)